VDLFAEATPWSTLDRVDEGLPRSDAEIAATRRRARWAVVGTAFVLFVVTRLTLSFDDIANPDIAGILYEADRILDGQLPYVATADFKQPAAFFLFAGIFTVAGRSIAAIEVVYGIWLLLGAIAVAHAARTLYDRAGDDGVASFAPFIAVALWLLSAGQFDYNYSAWMTVPLAGAFAALVTALHGARLHNHVVAGALATVACLFKAQAGVLVFVFVGAWLWARRSRQPGATWFAVAAWLTGAALALAPLLWVYGAAGELGTLWQSRLGLSEASAYAGHDWPLSPGRLLVEIARQHARVFQLGTALATVGLVSWWRDRTSRDAAPYLPAALLWSSGILAGTLGGPRYYAHYLVQYLPGLALLGAHPRVWGTLVSLRRAPTSLARQVAVDWTLRVAVAATLAWQLGEIPRGKGHRYDNIPRTQDGYTAPQVVGAFIREHSSPGDTIFVWGLTAWPVYFWAQRHAPTRVFKAMGQVTTYNTNTAFSPGEQIHFRPGPEADALVTAFRDHPPAFFVHANPWPGMGCAFDPLAEFTALQTELSRGYVGVFAFGGLQVFEHAAHARARGLSIADGPGP
jgi:hypothetical protein